MRKQNFTYLSVKAERVRKGTSHFWQSMQNESVDVELQLFGSKDRAEAELQIFGSQGRAEVWKRNIRSLGNIGLNPFLGPSYRVKKSPSSRRIGPLRSFVPAVFGRDVCLMSGSLSHVN